MLNDFQHLDLFPTSLEEIVVNLAVAMICGFCIAWLYRTTYKGPGYATSFVHAMVLLSMITAMVIMIIGNSLARAFGLVGAMSIIRFRTAVKETFDIVFIFFALTAGLAAGAGARLLAVAGTLIIGLIVALLSRSRRMGRGRKEYLLQFSAAANGDEQPAYLEVMKEHCRMHRVVNVKSVGDAGELEFSYYVQLREQEKGQHFLRDLKAGGARHINLYFDDEQF